MPKYYCNYCDTHLTHNSPSVRKTHCYGRKHIDNVKYFYQNWVEDQTQKMIDATTAAFIAEKMKNSNQFSGSIAHAAVPSPMNYYGPLPGPPGVPQGLPMMPPMMMGPMPPMMGMPYPIMGPVPPMMGPMGTVQPPPVQT